MIQLKNFLIKREQSQACLSFAKREKSRLLAKTILTLVALLAMTTGAWADGTVTVTEIKASEMPTSWDNNNNPVKATDLPGFTAVTRDDAKALGAPAAEGDIYVFYAISNNVFMGLHWNNGVLDDSDGGFSLGGIYALQDVFKFYYVAAPPSGPEVAWDKATKTGTFTMPGGNVTLEPEYYPQATVADGGVTAADADARATTDDPLVKVDATKLTGAKKLMYFVSNSGTSAPAYDAEGWTDQLPTAKGFTEAGNVYVWYYPVGIDEGVDGATATYSDGDICLQSITARIAPEPTYAVTFAEGTDPNEWSADPNADVKKGTPVTVTYTGTKKVIGVKAEKKAKTFAADEYNEASWVDTNKKVVYEKKKATTTPVAVADAATNVTWDAGWYTVSGNVTITGDVTLTADTHLILQDGATLTINGKLNCKNNYNLYIYGQKKGDGKLNVTNNSGTAIISNKHLDIHGGEVTASAAGNTGSGLLTGYLAVYGGKLTATSGITNGIVFGNTIDVYGGEVVATSNAISNSVPCYGIQGGSSASKILTVYGGKVTATGNGKESSSSYGSGFGCNVKSGTSGIKFYFSADGTTWGDGTSYTSATKVGLNDADAATKKRYAKAE